MIKTCMWHIKIAHEKNNLSKDIRNADIKKGMDFILYLEEVRLFVLVVLLLALVPQMWASSQQSAL